MEAFKALDLCQNRPALTVMRVLPHGDRATLIEAGVVPKEAGYIIRTELILRFKWRNNSVRIDIGVDPPSNPEENIKICKRVKADGRSRWVFVSRIEGRNKYFSREARKMDEVERLEKRGVAILSL